MFNFKSVLLIFFIIFATISCRDKQPDQIPEYDSIELLRGDIALCGYAPGLFGDVEFGSACSDEIREDFNLAIALLHSFEYDESEKVFAKVIDEDPECVMAYWGVAMCNFHALWEPPTKDDLEKGSTAIQIAKSLPSNSNREADYVDAIAAFYDDWEKVDHNIRERRFEKAMENLYNKYPEDKEAAVFYALALNASADLSDKTYSNQIKAGNILENLFPGEPGHPGIAHYIIHSYDYPKLAARALTAARRYASIAPASAHAQHMPSHIFTRMGLWEESISSNLDATSSAQCYAEQTGMDGHWDEEIHGVDYLVYAYLQNGRVSKAKELVDYLQSVQKITPISVKGAYPTAAIPARYFLETRQWDKAKSLIMRSQNYPIEDYPWANGVIHFARALGAIHANDLKAAENDIQKLEDCVGYLQDRNSGYMANQVEIMEKSAKAWLMLKKGKQQEALETMELAAELELKTEKQPLTPGEVLPAQELLGDLLMEAGQPLEALKAYEKNLALRPNRFNGIYGAAVAAKTAGNQDKARKYYSMLLDLHNSSQDTRSEIEEARLFIEQNEV